MRNSGRLVGFAAASALALIPLAVAAPAWADDEVSGETGAAVATPVGSGRSAGTSSTVDPIGPPAGSGVTPARVAPIGVALAGVLAVNPVQLTPDGRGYVYGYRRVLSDLYVVAGVR